MSRFLTGLLFCTLASITAAQEPAGVLPVDAEGRPLNLDFETGTLKDWVAEGKAFEGQPIKGDTVHTRRKDNKSQHQGDYWIGGFEKVQDKPQGTLTSVPFTITHPWGSFLVAGGTTADTCVELVLKDTNQVFFRASGMEEENLRRVAIDLQKYQGKQMFIRLVDKSSGPWGHLNFDDFRFHAQKPNVPPRPGLSADKLKFAGLPPEKAAQAMTLPECFDVTLFAGEPEVTQPVALALDDRGRVWVAEAHCYPTRRNDPKEAKDRILIFEDTQGTGKFDKRTVFMEGLNLVSGLEVGFGGVWIGAAPYLMFVPMKDDKAGEPQILLDGWGYQDTHETLNAFIWGPDGWLYGCHGVFTHSKVGKPGTLEKDRVPINAGVWRYHPIKHKFEVFAQGTSNPWGLDFNDFGQAFVSSCVIPHCFHIIQGARYHRQAGNHFNPHTYDDIKTIADHLHWQGANPWAGNDKSDTTGGGHAHCGLMCYLGGTWPAEYRGQLFMGNIHGRRINMDTLKPKGSGYVASHGKDLLLANDAWARFINMRYGPDGNVYLLDWYDKQACHNGNIQIWDRSNGRIYKISHRSAKPVVGIDLQKKSDQELVELQLHENDWYVRHARRILQERQPTSNEVATSLLAILKNNPDEKKRLRALWAAHACIADKKFANLSLELAKQDKSEVMRAWGIQLGMQAADKQLIIQGSTPIERLYLASALQKIPLAERWSIAEKLLSFGEDAADHNLPLMYWYAIEPLAEADPARALALALNGKIPQLHGFMVRRIGASENAMALLIDALAKTSDIQEQLTFMTALREALKGRRQVPMPQAWPKLFEKLTRSPEKYVRLQANCLAVTFGNPEPALKLVYDRTDTFNQKAAISALLDAGHPKLMTELRWLLDSELRASGVRNLALRGIAMYDDPTAPRAILSVYSTFTADEKLDALNTLASRPTYAHAMLDAIAKKQIAANEVSADIVRQLRKLKDKQVSARINEVWGIVRDTPEDRIRSIAQYKKMLRTSEPGDKTLGRAIFAKTCAQCHTLFEVGGKVGPDITGSNRANLDYLLENILDPSAVIPKEYTAMVIELKNGRTITGIVRTETPITLTLVTANEVLTLPRAEIDTITPSGVSMMPDDLLKQLKEDEVRALFAYLQSPRQVELKAVP